MTVRDGKIVEVEVYFGWSIPHEAPAGGSLIHKADSERAKHSLLALIQNAGDQNDQHDTL